MPQGRLRYAVAMSIAYIALGSNLGDRDANLLAALERLGALGTVEAVSPFFDTEPVGFTAQPRFLNAAARLRTSLAPVELLQGLLAVEAALGRVRLERWGPRVIDLDLLLYDDLISEAPGLSVPHPRLHERRFVLQPLAAIAPHAVHPRLRKTIADLLGQLDSGSRD